MFLWLWKCLFYGLFLFLECVAFICALEKSPIANIISLWWRALLYYLQGGSAFCSIFWINNVKILGNTQGSWKIAVANSLGILWSVYLHEVFAFFLHKPSLHLIKMKFPDFLAFCVATYNVNSNTVSLSNTLPQVYFFKRKTHMSIVPGLF